MCFKTLCLRRKCIVCWISAEIQSTAQKLLSQSLTAYIVCEFGAEVMNTLWGPFLESCRAYTVPCGVVGALNTSWSIFWVVDTLYGVWNQCWSTKYCVEDFQVVGVVYDMHIHGRHFVLFIFGALGLVFPRGWFLPSWMVDNVVILET